MWRSAILSHTQWVEACRGYEGTDQLATAVVTVGDAAPAGRAALRGHSEINSGATEASAGTSCCGRAE